MDEADKATRLTALLGTRNLNAVDAIKGAASWLDYVDPDDRDLILENLAFALAALGDWTSALEFTERIEGPYEKVEALYEIAGKSLLGGEPERALRLLDVAEKVALQTDELDYWQKAELLDKIARALVAAEAPDKANQIWEQAISIARLGEDSDYTQNSVDSSSVLWDITKSLAFVGQREKALAVAKAIKSPGKRERALQSLE